MKTIELTEWIPQLAAKYNVLHALMHMKAQQYARAYGMTWGMTMAVEDVDILKAEMNIFFTNLTKKK